MAGVTEERTSGTTSWEAAPVVSDRRRRPWPWVLVPLVLAVAVGVMVATQRRPGTDALSAPAAPAPGFDVTVRVADVASMDDNTILGRRPVAADDRAVDTAARDISRAVTDYLDAVFVTADTRFSDAPVASLLGPRARRAAEDADLRGLGVVDADAHDVAPEPVVVTARLVTDDGDVVLAAVRYEATADLVMADGRPGALHQRARMVLVGDDGGWRAEVAEADLDVRAVEVDR